MKVLIIGANGFIGNTLIKTILSEKDWEIIAIDLSDDKLAHSLGHERLQFEQADMTQCEPWLIDQIKQCDVVLPLAAIATPATYVQDPIRVFNLDFEENLKVVKWCTEFNTRIIFPSTSEVYGMCEDEQFDEETSNLVLGPIEKERWIYSCAKQMLDRVIFAYGKHKNLPYTLFRPFNWIGPTQDYIKDPSKHSMRVLTQFLSNIVYGHDIHLVDGGEQKRSFCYIQDGIDALIKIIENKNGCANGQIFNIGNPSEEASIKTLAETVLQHAKAFPKYADNLSKIKLTISHANDYYGKGYQDVKTRVPSIKNAQALLKWQPTVSFDEAVKLTVNYYLKT